MKPILMKMDIFRLKSHFGVPKVTVSGPVPKQVHYFCLGKKIANQHVAVHSASFASVERLEGRSEDETETGAAQRMSRIYQCAVNACRCILKYIHSLGL